MGWFNTGHEEFCVQFHPLKLWTRPNGHPMVGGSKHHLCKQKAHLRQPSPAWNMNWTYDDVQVQRPNNFGWFTHVCFLLPFIFLFVIIMLSLFLFFFFFFPSSSTMSWCVLPIARWRDVDPANVCHGPTQNMQGMLTLCTVQKVVNAP